MRNPSRNGGGRHRCVPNHGLRVIQQGGRVFLVEAPPTGAARYVGRVGALAVALGVGAAVASMPVAFADPTGSDGSTGTASSNPSSDSGQPSSRDTSQPDRHPRPGDGPGDGGSPATGPATNRPGSPNRTQLGDGRNGSAAATDDNSASTAGRRRHPGGLDPPTGSQAPQTDSTTSAPDSGSSSTASTDSTTRRRSDGPRPGARHPGAEPRTDVHPSTSNPDSSNESSATGSVNGSPGGPDAVPAEGATSTESDTAAANGDATNASPATSTPGRLNGSDPAPSGSVAAPTARRHHPRSVGDRSSPRGSRLPRPP